MNTTLSPNPVQMINLCVISYKDRDFIGEYVRHFNSDLEVVWGPAWRGLIADSLAYVTRSKSVGSYNVVIRGTNPISLSSWLKEDLAIGSTRPFSEFVPNAPPDAQVSEATANGLNDLLKLVPHECFPGHGRDLLGFLQDQAAIPSLFVTGHSLGGTLTPALYAYLYYELITKPGAGFPMNLMSFAGLTPGNAPFAHYLNGTIPQGSVWRYHNPLDIAPFLFDSESAVRDIYADHGLSWDCVVQGIIEHLFKEAKKNGYVQPPGGDLALSAVFDQSEHHSWAGQAAHQHHSTTYRTLITDGLQKTPATCG